MPCIGGKDFNPCLNSGNPIGLGGSCNCLCKLGFSGDNCEIS